MLLCGWWEKRSAPLTCSWLTDGGCRLLPSPQCYSCVTCPPVCVSVFCIYSVWHLNKALGLWSSGARFAFFFFFPERFLYNERAADGNQSVSQSVLAVPSLCPPPLSMFTTQQDWHLLRLRGREDHEHDSEHNAPLIMEDESQSLECSLGTGCALYCRLSRGEMGWCQNVAVEVNFWHNFNSLPRCTEANKGLTCGF